MHCLALARGGGYLLTEDVEHFGGFQVLAGDGDEASGGVGMESGEGGNTIFINIIKRGLTPTLKDS